MAALSLIASLLGAAALAWPRHGKFVALGLALFAVLVGLWGRRKAVGPRSARARLVGAGGLTVGVIVLLLAAAKVTLTLVAVDHLGGVLGP